MMTMSGSLPLLRRVLVPAPRAARHPHLLRVVARQEVHGGLPDVRERNERQDPQTDRHQQPLRVQTYLQLEGKWTPAVILSESLYLRFVP